MNLHVTGQTIAAPRPAFASTDLSAAQSKGMVVAFWIITGIFCLQMGFTAYAQLRLPQVAEMFTHLGFPDYFRVELSWAKLLGVALLLAPVPARLKEWAYAGFAITLGSALVAHFAVGDGLEMWTGRRPRACFAGCRIFSGAACRSRRCRLGSAERDTRP